MCIWPQRWLNWILNHPGSLVALDAEFVCAEKEEYEVRDDGRRTLVKPARLVSISSDLKQKNLSELLILSSSHAVCLFNHQVLARVSVVRGDRSERMGEVLIDDYIRTSEPVVDYLTKYSGIQPGTYHPPHKRAFDPT